MHPAKILFKKLFDVEAATDQPALPSYFVPRWTFHDKCRKAGIDVPTNPIRAVEWEESIGLPDFVHRVISAHHRARGTTPSESEKAARKHYRQSRRKR